MFTRSALISDGSAGELRIDETLEVSVAMRWDTLNAEDIDCCCESAVRIFGSPQGSRGSYIPSSFLERALYPSPVRPCKLLDFSGMQPAGQEPLAFLRAPAARSRHQPPAPQSSAPTKRLQSSPPRLSRSPMHPQLKLVDLRCQRKLCGKSIGGDYPPTSRRRRTRFRERNGDHARTWPRSCRS